MAIISGDRESRRLFPASIEEYVGQNDPVRVYDLFVDQLDFKELGIDCTELRVGAPNYDPHAMLKMWVYGISYGFRSPRKLERACNHNVSFMWLLGGLTPDYKTISEFRRNNLSALKKVLLLCGRLCIRMKLIDGNVLFVDGSKFRANANINKFWTDDKCQKVLNHLKNRIDELLRLCEEQDRLEESCGSFVKVVNASEEVEDKVNLKEKVEQAVKELKLQEKRKKQVEKIAKALKDSDCDILNSTDKDCVKTKGRQGAHAGYTAQVVTDDKSGLIVSCDVVSANNDHYQLNRQVKQAEEVLEKEVDTVCADNGYHQIEDLKKLHDAGKQVVVPSRKQSSRKGLSPFDRENFVYDESQNEYICPAGHRLRYKRFVKGHNAYEYIIASKKNCISCIHFGECTKSKQGRCVQRSVNEELKKKLEKVYDSPEGQEIYGRRKERAELPFGHLKRNLGADYFLLRGRKGVNAEMSLLCTSFNIRRMISLLGVPTLLGLLGGS